MPGAFLIYSTHPTLEQARATARSLLDQKLAACCNIVPGIESHYEWQGARQQSPEVLMLSKTSEPKAEALMAAIQALHPYDCPAIVKLAISGGSPDFLRFIETGCQ